jgi:hypothetical protein
MNGDREHIVIVPMSEMARLRKWMDRPNGSFRHGRVTFEAVEGGSIWVRTRPWGKS